MARFKDLNFLLSRRVFAFIVFLGFIPVVGTVIVYCPWFRWVLQ